MQEAQEVENKLRGLIKNSHLGSGKLLKKVYQDWLAFGLSQQDIEKALSNDIKE
jgi:DNA-binding transcriptional MocR family regulator